MIGSLELLAILLLLGILAAIVVAIIVAAFLIRRTRESAPRTARDILDARYANGEITKAEYEEMRAQLEDQI